MNRRFFLKSLAAGVYAFAHLPLLRAALPKMKITRVRAYAPPNPNPLFNQADTVVTIETDAGITGIGEGGFPDTLKQCAGRLIGQDPQYIERLWQDMSRSFFYPPGREKEHALGALDLALWDIKGKVLKLPVHEILGGMVRNYCECYNTAGIIPGIKPGMSVKERAAATIAAGYRAFAWARPTRRANTTFNTRQKVNQLYEECVQAREGVGKDGDWCVDFHQRFDLSDAIRGCEMIESLAPLFVEDPVRDGGFRRRSSAPAKTGEGADRRGRGMGQPLGLQSAGGESRYRLCARDAAERRRHHRDDEDRGDLRDALRRHRAALHGTDRDRGAGEFAGHILGPAADGIQL